MFKGELGTLHLFEVSFTVDNGARLQFRKARVVPYSVRDDVEKELDRLESEGILVKIDHSEWATPIVAVPKCDGTCRDRSQ